MDEERLSQLFKQLDINKDGLVDAKELEAGLKRLGVNWTQDQAQEIVRRGDEDWDGRLDFREFAKYMIEHEQNLRVVFRDIDINKDGILDKAEIKAALKRLGLNVTDREVDRLVEHMDKEGNLTISWDEWREYLLLQPVATVREIFRIWRHATAIDIGENGVIPDDFSEEEKVSGMWWRLLVAGGGAGAVSRTFTAPLDRLKVLLQVQAGGSASARLGIISGLREMISEGGPRSLWRGNGINVLKIAPESALKFFFYEKVKQLFTHNRSQVGVGERFLAGSIAGACSQTIIYPMELLKTRLALRKTGQYHGIFHATRSIMQTEGLRSFYRGLLPNLIGIIPYAGIDLMVYETLKNRWLNQHPSTTNPGVFVLLACGTVSCTCGQLASYPLALIRTKLQAETTRVGITHERQGMVSVVRTILREDGPTGLYRGLGPNFLKVIPAVSISYVVYERLKSVLSVRTY
ncbi:calcium-binding mitochondrial carrier protein SCaMC-2-like [Corticium candelabrum]|uniref:calcium-binding mitochondrial carrier protein SCaMC-2-like n=1 Tax=Corticium candelabrum TaxID=121492 RepID=UPI002E274A9B|nr:calcium-binding mitochondrial carrier protein SCaMC-2-like [Corticium candelabrum]